MTEVVVTLCCEGVRETRVDRLVGKWTGRLGGVSARAFWQLSTTEEQTMKELGSLEEWEERLGRSDDESFFVFKHSTTCPISARAKDRVDMYVDGAGDSVPEFLLVKVIESRVVSNAIADGVGVRHASPQLILVKSGKGVWNTSHHLIASENIESALQDFD